MLRDNRVPSNSLDDLNDVTISNIQNNDIISWDSTSQEWVNVSVTGTFGTSGSSGSSGTSGISGSSGSSGTSGITPGGIFVDSTSGDIFYYDDTRQKNLGIAIIQASFGRNSIKVTNRYLELEGNSPSNLNGFPLPYDATLIAISMSEELNTETWIAEIRKNGIVTVLDYLQINSQYSNASNNNNIDFNIGDRVQLYLNGSNISNPHTTLFFRRKL